MRDTKKEGISGGGMTRAIRSRQLWLTVGYVSVLLLLARTYA